MSLVVAAAGAVRASDIEARPVPPAWRKATRNMILAMASIERALALVPSLAVRRSEMGLVLGSNSGELETSAEFLTTLARTRMARPVLFQNSLHNATTGFLSIQLGLTGPSVTISSGAATSVECVSTAASMISASLCRACLVTIVEAHRGLARLLDLSPDEGACTLLVASADRAPELGARVAPLPEIPPLETRPEYAPLVELPSTRFFARVAELEKTLS